MWVKLSLPETHSTSISSVFDKRSLLVKLILRIQVEIVIIIKVFLQVITIMAENIGFTQKYEVSRCHRNKVLQVENILSQTLNIPRQRFQCYKICLRKFLVTFFSYIT